MALLSSLQSGVDLVQKPAYKPWEAGYGAVRGRRGGKKRRVSEEVGGSKEVRESVLHTHTHTHTHTHARMHARTHKVRAKRKFYFT